MKKFLLLSIGGLLGTFARYFVTEIIGKYSLIFIGTMAVNTLGCFIIGFFSESIFVNKELKLLLMTGFCGAFTTFSAFIFETNNIIKTHNLLMGAINIIINIMLGYLFFKLGSTIYLKFI